VLLEARLRAVSVSGQQAGVICCGAPQARQLRLSLSE